MFHSSFWRRLAVAVTSLLLLTMALPSLMSPRTALAQGNSISVVPNSGNPGTPVTATGDGWPANDPQIQIWFDQTFTGKSTSANANGHFSVGFNIPSNATQGLHPVYALDGKESASTPFTVYVLTVQKVLTGDSSNNTKTSFVSGDTIHYLVYVKNWGSTTLTATFTFVATGPRQIFYFSGPVPVAPGTPGFYSPSTVPTDAPSGTYTLTVTVSLNGLSSAKSSQFKISFLRLPWVSGTYNISGYSYGCGDHVDNPGTKYRDTFALDFGLPLGTHVAAVADGIAYTGNDGNTNYGNYIWIAHTNPNGSFNGYVSLYAHLSSFHITNGQSVKRGDWIGNSGSTGNSNGPHLHFSWRSGFDGTHLSSAAPAKPEPMSGYTGFGHYGYTKDNGCSTFVPSPAYTV